LYREETNVKVGIVGTGWVGSTAAYALVMRGIGQEIVMIDKNTKRAQAEADDILHAVPFAHSLRVWAGEYSDLAGCRVVILASFPLPLNDVEQAVPKASAEVVCQAIECLDAGQDV
jgi:malate/lactate dehydrogenase